MLLPHLRIFPLYIIYLGLLLATSAVAQIGTANVSGTVEDSTGARIADATVTLVNTQTGTENDSKTSHNGTFLLPDVFPGIYTLEVMRSSFATIQVTGLTLNVGDAKNFLIRMQVGLVTQTVNIDASGITPNAADGSVSTIVDRQFVASIPLNGRSFQDLISMTPGIVTQSPQVVNNVASVNGDFSVNGQRSDTNSYNVDGVSADTGVGSLAGRRKLPSPGHLAGATALGTTQSLTSVDALQEFRVLSSTYSTEYGFTSGGQFSLLTRSGTSTIHGSAYDYLRKSVYDASDWFARYYSDGPLQNPYHQQDFGATLGGPLVIPGIYNGLNRTFFFGSYEGFRVYQPTAPLVFFVPARDVVQSAPAALKPILEAFQTNGFTALKFSTSQTGLTALLSAPFSLPSSIDAASMRFDHSFSTKLSAFFRYSVTPSESESEARSTLTDRHLHGSTLTFGATEQFSPRATNDFRVGYAWTDSRLNANPTNQTTFGNELNADMGIPASYSDAATDAYIQIAGAGDSDVRTDNAYGSLHLWNLRDTFTTEAAHHILRTGIDVRHIASRIVPPPITVEAAFLNRESMMENLASAISITKSRSASPVFEEFAAFLQDEWHLSNALTLSPGLRWEVTPAPHGEHGEDAYTLIGNIASPATLRLAPRGTPLWNTGWLNLAPRMGIAWIADPTSSHELVVRAGAGIFFDTANRAAMGAFTALGFSSSRYQNNLPLPVAAAQFNFPNVPTAPYTDTVAYAFPRHLHQPYTIQWNVAVEKALGRNQSVTATWIGADGRRLLRERRININIENPEFGEMSFFPGGVTSNYQSLQLKFQRSIAPGLQALVSYIWSHTLDYGSIAPQWSLTYGNSDLDVRQNVEAAFSWNERSLSGNWLRRYLLGGWSADGRLTARTGYPVTPLGNLYIDPATGLHYFSGVDWIPNRPLYLHEPQYPGGRIVNGGLNTSIPAFVLPADGTAGNAPRNMLRGFGDAQVNVALRREISMGDRFHLQLRGEAFNLFNHPNLGYIDPHLTDLLFGQSTLLLNQSFGPIGSLYATGGPRSIQLSLRVHF